MQTVSAVMGYAFARGAKAGEVCPGKHRSMRRGVRGTLVAMWRGAAEIFRHARFPRGLSNRAIQPRNSSAGRGLAKR